jgi:cytoskeletal protein CcmA (bactofilin family)
VNGNIAFSGFLRIHGDVVGDILCDSDSNGTTVVHGSGTVTGTIRSPNIVVGGRVEGPLHASESVEVHPDASVVGDISYKKIAIHAGGVINGTLMPTAPMESGRVKMERRILQSESQAVKELDVPVAHDRRSTDRFWSGRKIGVVLALLIAVAVVMWMRRHPATSAPPAPPPAVSFAPELYEKPVPVVPTLLATHDADGPKTPRVEPAAVVPEPRVEPRVVVPPPAVAPTASVVPAPAPARPKADPDKVVTIQGMDSTKPGSNFYVISKAPVVLYRKLRKDAGDGLRIDVPRGANIRIAISENEVLRVDHGQDVELFYQGRKVPPTAIANGAWLSFVPLPPGETIDVPR